MVVCLDNALLQADLAVQQQLVHLANHNNNSLQHLEEGLAARQVRLLVSLLLELIKVQPVQILLLLKIVTLRLV